LYVVFADVSRPSIASYTKASNDLRSARASAPGAPILIPNKIDRGLDIAGSIEDEGY
jgi:hypothetical protein